jgi:hypothetical protein
MKHPKLSSHQGKGFHRYSEVHSFNAKLPKGCKGVSPISSNKQHWTTVKYFLPLEKEQEYRYLEPRIRNTVKRFNELGFVTIGSCQGHDKSAEAVIEFGSNKEHAIRQAATSGYGRQDIKWTKKDIENFRMGERRLRKDLEIQKSKLQKVLPNIGEKLEIRHDERGDPATSLSITIPQNKLKIFERKLKK